MVVTILRVMYAGRDIDNYTNQCYCYKCAGLERGTVWNGRFYCCLRSRSAGKRGRTDTGSHRKLHSDRSCG